MTFAQDDRDGKNTKITELKSLFDYMMHDGYNFEEVKKVYMEIKALEAEINYANWKKDKPN